MQAGLYRFAKSLLNHREEAEDCVQEVMVKLWTKRKTLAGVVNLKAFTSGILISGISRVTFGSSNFRCTG